MAPGNVRGPDFENLRQDLLEHMWRRFPQHCVALTDPQTMLFVDLAIERAAGRGFHWKNEIFSYANVMVYLGSYFDEDPQWDWAGESLMASASLDPAQRMARLYARMNEVLRTLAGDRGEYYRRTLIWAGSQPFEALAEDGAGSTEERIHRWLKKGYIRKEASLTDEAVSQIGSLSRFLARQYGLDGVAGTMLLSELMLLLGCGIDREPLHPWIAEVLRQTSPSDPLAKAKRLHERANAELQRYMNLDRITRKG